MKHYTFKIYFKREDALIEGGAVGETFDHALAWFKMQPEVIDFIQKNGEIDRVELISEEPIEEATPEAARAKGMKSLALATYNRIAGDHRVRIGQELMEARNDMGYSIEYVAQQIGVKPVTIRNIEEGRFSATIDLLSKIAECYGCELAVCDKE